MLGSRIWRTRKDRGYVASDRRLEGERRYQYLNLSDSKDGFSGECEWWRQGVRKCRKTSLCYLSGRTGIRNHTKEWRRV